MSAISLKITDRDGGEHSVTADAGVSLMSVLREHIDLTLGTCGGAISCGTCLVRLSPEWAGSIAPAGEDEAEMLEALGAEGVDARLSCQLLLDDAANGMSAAITPAE